MFSFLSRSSIFLFFAKACKWGLGFDLVKADKSCVSDNSHDSTKCRTMEEGP